MRPARILLIFLFLSGGATLEALLVRFPVGRLHGVLALPRGETPISSLDVRFQTRPGSPSAPSLEGTVSCPVREGSLTCALPAGAFDLRLRSEGWVPVYLWGVQVDSGRIKDLGTLPLRRGSSVSGWIRLENGEPPPAGCKVELSPAKMAGPMEISADAALRRLTLEAEVNGRGFYQLSGVPPGQYELQASLSGFAPARMAPIEVRKDLEAQVLEPLVLGRPATLEVILDPPVEPYGKPWKILLTRRPYDTGPALESFEGEASPEGIWTRAGLPPGFYEILILGEMRTRWAADFIEIRVGSSPLHVEIPVLRVRGLVTQGREPFSTTLWWGRDGRSLRFDSDAEGRFAGALPGEGTWTIEVRSEDRALRLPLDPVRVEAREDGRPVEVEIVVPNTKLAGEVVDEAGTPLPAAAIRFHHSKPRRHGRFKADEKGRFSIRGLPSGPVSLRAEHADLSGEWMQASLEEDAESPWLRLVVRRLRTLEGRTVSVHGGVPGALIVAFPPFNGQSVSSGSHAVTGPQGDFKLRVPPGTMTLDLFVYPPGFAFRMASALAAPGQTLEVPVEAAGGTLVLEFGEGSASIPSSQIVHGGTFSPVDPLLEWARMQGVHHQEPARLVIPNVEAGPYSLCVGAAVSGRLREGLEPPATNCTSGVLAPHGELVLKAPRDPG